MCRLHNPAISFKGHTLQKWVQLCSSLSILCHCLSLGLEWKLTFSSPVAIPEFSKFAGILSAALSQHHLLGFAWKIPWTEEPGRLQSMGSLRVGHDWATSLSLFTFMHWRRKWQPTPVFLPRIPGTAGPGGLPSMGSHRVGHDWSDLAAAAAVLLLRLWVCKYCWYLSQAV